MEFEAVNDQRLNRFDPKYKPIYNALIEKYFTKRAKTILPQRYDCFKLTSDNVILEKLTQHQGLALADFFNIYFIMFDDEYEYATLKISVDWYGKITAVDYWNRYERTRFHTKKYYLIDSDKQNVWRQQP